MSWETLRDLGLIAFVTGALVTFGLSRVFHRQLGAVNAALMSTIGDAMMLAGACLAVTAMVIGYLASGASQP